MLLARRIGTVLQRGSVTWGAHLRNASSRKERMQDEESKFYADLHKNTQAVELAEKGFKDAHFVSIPPLVEDKVIYTGPINKALRIVRVFLPPHVSFKSSSNSF